MSAAVAVVSGGMDSVTLAYLMKTDPGATPPGFLSWDDLTIVSVDYGQRHRKELAYAAQCAADLAADHVVVDLRSVGAALTGSSLTDDVAVPEGHYAEDTMRATVVPNRNAILASIAYGVAVARGASTVALGVHAGDHAIYPDCRGEFVDLLSHALRAGSTWHVGDEVPYLVAPFVGLSKADIVRVGAQIGVPYERTWSCYVGGDVHCGRCGTCVERAEAFAVADVDDPTTYADPDYWRTVTR